MRKALVVFAAAILISMPGVCAEPSFSLSLSQVANSPGSEKKIIVHIVLRNTSDHDILVTRSPLVDVGDGTGFIFAVHDSQGNTPSETDFARERKTNTHRPTNSNGLSLPSGWKLSPPPIERSDIGVQSNATFERKVDLSRLYDLTKPGRYTIQVERMDPDSKVVVKSNIVVINVSN